MALCRRALESDEKACRECRGDGPHRTSSEAYCRVTSPVPGSHDTVEQKNPPFARSSFSSFSFLNLLPKSIQPSLFFIWTEKALPYRQSSKRTHNKLDTPFPESKEHAYLALSDEIVCICRRPQPITLEEGYTARKEPSLKYYMPHLISTSKPKRIFNYFLSLIGLDRFVISHDDDDTNQEPASSCSFLTASTLFVTHDDKKQAAPDAWTLQSWIGGLSKSVLCQIVWMGVMQYHDSTMWPQLDEPQKKNEEQDVIDELKTIQEQANKIAHRLDALRPSEQFAHAAQVAQEFQQLVRLCVHLLHEDPLAATVAIMLIVQESFVAPPEVRQHVYYQAKLGRLVVLELESVLKYHQGHLKRAACHRVDYYSLCAQTNHRTGEQDGCWLEELGQLCAKLARYDTTWEFRQEYQNVVRLAEQFYV